MATKRTRKSITGPKQSEPTATPAPTESAPAESAPAEPDGNAVERLILSRLFAPGVPNFAAMAAYRETVQWGDRYKPSVEEMLRARDVAAAVVAAILSGDATHWKRLTDAWYLLRGLDTQAAKTARASEHIQEILYASSNAQDAAKRESVALALRKRLAYIDSEFANLQLGDIVRTLEGASPMRPSDPAKKPKGGSKNAGPHAVLAKLCVLCGAFGATMMNPLVKLGRAEVARMRRKITIEHSRSGRPPLRFNEMLIPGRIHRSP